MIRLSFETSGTTGEPKRIEHSLDAMVANAKAFNEMVGLDGVTLASAYPSAHIFTLGFDLHF